jgi:phage gp29-like protein
MPQSAIVQVGRIGDTVPILRRVAQPPLRDRWAAATQLGGVTPEKLYSIEREAERGRMESWSDLCDLMLDTDPHLSGVYETRINSVAHAPYTVVPGKRRNDVVLPIDETAANFCRSVIEQIPNMEDALGFINEGVGRGFSVAENEYSRSDGAWVISRILWRNGRRFQFDDRWCLRLYDGGIHGPDGLELDPRKFIVYTPKQRGAYPTRSGLLRKVTWAWLFKRWVLKFWVSAAERLGTPLAAGKLPVNADPAVQSHLLETLERLSSQQAVVVMEPTSIEFLDTKIREGSATFRELEQFLNSEESKAILGNTLTTEVQDVGARATATTQNDSAQLPRLKADGRRLAGNAIEQQVFAPLLYFNQHLFGGQIPQVPKFVFNFEPEPPAPELQEFHLRGRLMRRNEARQRLGLSELTPEEGGDELLDLTTGAPGGVGTTPQGDLPVPPLSSAPGGEPTAGPLVTVHTRLKASPAAGRMIQEQLNLPTTRKISPTSVAPRDPLAAVLFGQSADPAP